MNYTDDSSNEMMKSLLYFKINENLEERFKNYKEIIVDSPSRVIQYKDSQCYYDIFQYSYYAFNIQVVYKSNNQSGYIFFPDIPTLYMSQKRWKEQEKGIDEFCNFVFDFLIKFIILDKLVNKHNLNSHLKISMLEYLKVL